MKKIISVMMIIVLFLTFAGCKKTDSNVSYNSEDETDIRHTQVDITETEKHTETLSESTEEKTTQEISAERTPLELVDFTVKEPQAIAGITGSISPKGGKLTFEGLSLGFELLADGSVSPVSAPWILMKTLRSGYLTSCGVESGCIRVAIDDSYEEDALHLDFWLDEKDLPKRGEILWQGRRILSLDIENFVFL